MKNAVSLNKMAALNCLSYNNHRRATLSSLDGLRQTSEALTFASGERGSSPVTHQEIILFCGESNVSLYIDGWAEGPFTS